MNDNRMSEFELVAILNNAEEDAAIYNGEFMAENEQYLKEYLGELYGDEVEGQSKAVSTDVADVIESDMPSLVRVFLGSGDILSFVPTSGSKDDEQEAEEKTQYVNWCVKSQPDSFKIIHDWIKDALIQKCGVVKYCIDEAKEVEDVSYTGVSLEELQALEASLQGADVSKVKVELAEEYSENGETYDVKFRVTRINKHVKIINVPPESFLISKAATSKDDAELIGDTVRKTRGQLLAEGYKRELIDLLPSQNSEKVRAGTLNSIRNDDQGGEDYGSDVDEWASEEVELSDLYVKVDYDGDGIAERRHILKSGNIILKNENFNHVPYAINSAVLMPHKAIGRSRAEIVSPKQRQKTALLRGMLNNIYMVNNPRNVVHPDVDLDDMLTVRVNGIVRMEEDTKILPQQAVMPLTTPYVGDGALQVIQYIDSARAQSTGTLMANQGLDADAIAKETATRFEGVERASEAKIELIARNFAETGFRALFEGIAWMATRFQNENTEIMVLGKPLTLNPGKWKYKHWCNTQVGLGAGNNERLVAALQGIYTIQQQLKAQGSVLADEVDIYNTLKRITDGLGLPRVDEFFNNPEIPDETLKAQNEILQAQLMQMQQMLQQMQNPLQQAEETRAQAKLIEAQGKQGLEAAKLQENARQFDAEMMFKMQKQLEDLAKAMTDMELKYNKNVPGSVV